MSTPTYPPLMPQARDWECLRKTRFDTVEQAHSRMQVYNRRTPWKRLHVYRCRFCEKWHIGREKPKRVE